MTGTIDPNPDHNVPSEIAEDFQYIPSTMIGVAISTKKENQHTIVLSVFEDQIVPEIKDGVIVGIKTVRKARANIAMLPAMVEKLHATFGEVLDHLNKKKDATAEESEG